MRRFCDALRIGLRLQTPSGRALSHVRRLRWCVASIVLVVALSSANAFASEVSDPSDATLRRRFGKWLERPVGVHPEFLEHGTLAPLVDVGAPHLYRVGLRVGVLDVLTLGVVSHWRSGDMRPRVAPELGLAIYRGKTLSLGFRYRYLFHPEPDLDSDEKSDPDDEIPDPKFMQVSQYAVGSAGLSRGYFSVGVEAGIMRRREMILTEEELNAYLFENRWVMATGMFIRGGTSRWGVCAQIMMPTPEINVRFEWRFALFAREARRDPLSAALREADARQSRLQR